MIVYMIDRHGRARIARFVADEIARQGTSARAVGAAPGRPSLPTIKRIRAEDPNISDTMLRALGGKLKLPADWLVYIGTGDARRIQNSGASPDLIRITLDLFEFPTPPQWSDRSGS